MTGFLLGAILTVGVGFLVMLATDRGVRDGAVAALWGLAVGPVMLALVALVGLARIVGLGRRRYPILKGRRLSTAALRRTTARLDTEGWAVTWRGGGILWIRKVDK